MRHRGSRFPSSSIISVYSREQTAFVFSLSLFFSILISFSRAKCSPMEESDSWLVTVFAGNARSGVPLMREKERERLQTTAAYSTLRYSLETYSSSSSSACLDRLSNPADPQEVRWHHHRSTVH